VEKQKGAQQDAPENVVFILLLAAHLRRYLVEKLYRKAFIYVGSNEPTSIRKCVSVCCATYRAPQSACIYKFCFGFQPAPRK